MIRLAGKGRPGAGWSAFFAGPLFQLRVAISSGEKGQKGMGEFYDAISDFIFVEDTPQKADVIFVPGGNYPDAAVHAATLYRQGFAPYILPSGKYSISVGKFVLAGQTKNAEKSADRKKRVSYETEFDYLHDILVKNGVDEAAILKEDQATFTYQNAIFSRQVLEMAGISVKRAILCCQAFHARRALLYYQEQFPKTEFVVCPVVTRGIGRDTWMKTAEGIDTVLGEVERCGSQFHEILREHWMDHV